jgi:hypothetical protein
MFSISSLKEAYINNPDAVRGKDTRRKWSLKGANINKY